MGLINEVHSITQGMNRKERERAEREQKKQLILEYNAEIKSNLQAVFYNLFENYTPKEAYKKAILQKSKNIDQLTKHIERIGYTENGRKYSRYDGHFDIVGDLNACYFIELEKIKKEYEKTEKINTQELQKTLEQEFYKYFKMNYKKYIIKQTLQENDSMETIIQDIATTEQEQEILKENYSRTLAKVSKYFQGDIIKERQEIKQQKEQARQQAQAAKIARRDRLLCLHILNRWLK